MCRRFNPAPHHETPFMGFLFSLQFIKVYPVIERFGVIIEPLGVIIEPLGVIIDLLGVIIEPLGVINLFEKQEIVIE